MKTKLTILCIILIISLTSKAQNYVTIPDANFVTWLQAHVPSAMNGNQMDTSSTAVTSLVRMDVENKAIVNLYGVQYFDSLKTLDCGNGVNSNANTIAILPTLPTNLDTLICGNNKLTHLPSLPNTLTFLKCYQNQITSLPVLPNSLLYMDCSVNYLQSISLLPNSLQYIDCSWNQLANLPLLPNSLQNLTCYTNGLTSLPPLPNSLQTLNCYHNQLISLPILPNSLQYLMCNQNQLTTLPLLPNALQMLVCFQNHLTSLPLLPSSLQSLVCNQNQLTSLPLLPNSLHNLACSQNQLLSLPLLPTSITQLSCNTNSISCFPVFPNSLISAANFNISSNPFSCLPNYVAAMDATTLAYPLCAEGDMVHNPNGCAGSTGIIGSTYKDVNHNCTQDQPDRVLPYVHLKLYDVNNNLISQNYSAINGTYNFAQPAGTYTVKLDTAGMPFTTQCINPNIGTTVTVSAGTPLVNNVNFDVSCKPNFDLGTQAVNHQGWVFPGIQHLLSVLAGDISQWYNFACATGQCGQVIITVTGPVVFNGVPSGAQTPGVSGHVFTYNISDFGNINMLNNFALLFTTLSTAQSGDPVCINVKLTGCNSDSNPGNNNYQFCYTVQNSHDPNYKEVYPVDVQPGFNDYFTYTVHFQNTGTAPAMNIQLLDTLDNNLDLETFQVINYSHYNTVQLNGNVLTFHFPNIQLPDSTSNLAGSQGYVQYRIKPKTNLPVGTKIKNTANIYFDYNAPVVTNTTTNEYTLTAAVNEIKANTTMSVFPNPSNGRYYVNVSDAKNNSELSIEVYNSIGELVLTTKMQSTEKEIDLSHEPNGIYIVRIVGAPQSLNQRVVKQ